MCCLCRFPSAARGAQHDPKSRRARRLGHRPKRPHDRPSRVGFCGLFVKRQNRRRNTATTKKDLSSTPRRSISPHEQGDRGAVGPHPNTKTSADAATRRHDRHPKTQPQRRHNHGENNGARTRARKDTDTDAEKDMARTPANTNADARQCGGMYTAMIHIVSGRAKGKPT